MSGTKRYMEMQDELVRHVLDGGDGFSDEDHWFGENLRVYRERTGESATGLAKKMADLGFQFHPMTITRIENGQRSVRLGEAKALAMLMNTSLDDLARRPGEAVALGDLRKAIEGVEHMLEGLERGASAAVFAQQHLRAALWVAREVVGIDDPAAVKVAERLLDETPEARAKTGRQAGEDDMWSEACLAAVRQALAAGKPWEKELNEHLDAERARHAKRRSAGAFADEVERAMRARRPKKGTG